MSVRVIFLGGLGAIGRNCAVLEDQGRLMVVDVGLMFPEEDMLGVDLVFPDWSWLVERSDQVEGVVLTHGHEDHVGALSYFLRDLNVPVYGTEFTLEMAGGRLEGAAVSTDFRQVQPHRWYEQGPFRFSHIPVVHSVPDATAVVFDTSEGIVLHSGDFKLDPTPIGSYITDLPAFASLGQQGVRLLLSDSTNAEVPGFVPSERSLADPIYSIIRDAPSRVIAACFSSHVHRIRQIAEAGLRTKRKLAFLGFSMERITSTATELGLLDLPSDSVVEINQLLSLPPHQQLLITTGSQGEPFAALSRMSRGHHRVVKVKPKDTILISAHPIPGNETAVSRVISRLTHRGAQVFHGRNANVHVSGHGYRKELQTFINVVRPQAFVPVHGELRHLHAHAELAREMGVPWVEVLEDGDAVMLEGTTTYVERKAVKADYVYFGGSEIWCADHDILGQKRQLANGGMLAISVVVDDENGQVLVGPILEARGMSYHLEEWFDQVQDAVIDAIRRRGKGLWDKQATVAAIRSAASKVLRSHSSRCPLITAIIHYV